MQRTDRRIDKRIDYRHHLIDELVTGLTDRSLYMGMAKGYKERMEQRAAGVRGIKPWQTPEPPLRNIREVALKLVREVKVKHKTDRYPSGMYFKGKAYNRILDDKNKSRLVISCFLHELTDALGSIESARKNISDIVSSETRNAVSKIFEERINDRMTAVEALNTPIPDSRYGTRHSTRSPLSPGRK